VLRKISGRKRDEIIGGWRKLHNGELRSLYVLPDVLRLIKTMKRWPGHAAHLGEKGTILVVMPERRRPL
jgi:hypothetical protein